MWTLAQHLTWSSTAVSQQCCGSVFTTQTSVYETRRALLDAHESNGALNRYTMLDGFVESLNTRLRHHFLLESTPRLSPFCLLLHLVLVSVIWPWRGRWCASRRVHCFCDSLLQTFRLDVLPQFALPLTAPLRLMEFSVFHPFLRGSPSLTNHSFPSGCFDFWTQS